MIPSPHFASLNVIHQPAASLLTRLQIDAANSGQLIVNGQLVILDKQSSETIQALEEKAKRTAEKITHELDRRLLYELPQHAAFILKRLNGHSVMEALPPVNLIKASEIVDDVFEHSPDSQRFREEASEALSRLDVPPIAAIYGRNSFYNFLTHLASFKRCAQQGQLMMEPGVISFSVSLDTEKRRLETSH